MSKQKQKIRYCLLAKTIPEYSKRDNSLYTCSIGFSPQLGLIRVYPLPPKGMNKWNIYEIEVEKNKRDNREESWKLSSMSRKNGWNGAAHDIKEVGTVDKVKFLSSLLPYVAPSISQLNKDRKSIGLIKVDSHYNLRWQENKRYINTKQVGMFEDVELADFTKFTKETKIKESRIIFRDGDGKHNLQFNEWGVYVGQDKWGATKEIFKNYNGKKGQYLLVGNMMKYRINWIGLSLFAIPQQSNLF